MSTYELMCILGGEPGAWSTCQYQTFTNPLKYLETWEWSWYLELAIKVKQLALNVTCKLTQHRNFAYILPTISHFWLTAQSFQEYVASESSVVVIVVYAIKYVYNSALYL